ALGEPAQLCHLVQAGCALCVSRTLAWHGGRGRGQRCAGGSAIWGRAGTGGDRALRVHGGVGGVSPLPLVGGITPTYLPHQRGRCLSTRWHNRGQAPDCTSPLMGEVGGGVESPDIRAKPPPTLDPSPRRGRVSTV